MYSFGVSGKMEMNEKYVDARMYANAGGALSGDRLDIVKMCIRDRYIGKELDTMYGWNMQDHEARWYDPVLGRWMVTDLSLIHI